MQKKGRGYDLENTVGLKNGKGLDEGTKAGMKGRLSAFQHTAWGTYLNMEQQMGRNLKLMSRQLQKS